MNRLASFLPACAAALVFLASNSPAATPPEPSPSPLAAANCALTLPPGWHPLEISKPPNGMAAAFADAKGTRTLMVFVFRRGQPYAAMNAANAAEFDRGVESSGGSKKTAGRFTRVGGFEAYERRGTMKIKDRDTNALALAIPTGDGLYLLEIFTPQSAPVDDPEIAQAVDSFHFLRPPGAPIRPAEVTPIVRRPATSPGQPFAWLGGLLLVLRLVYRFLPKRRAAPPTGFTGAEPVLYKAGLAATAALPPPLPVAATAPAPPRSPDIY